jgi:hypothetical protein
MISYWRGRARPIIAQVIKDNKGKDLKAVRKALYEAYPFGVRKHHPYKIWLDEIARQLNEKKRYFAPKKKPANPKQIKLF